MNQAKHNRHRAAFLSAAAAVALLMAGATGCGGGKTTRPGSVASSGPITRANESTVSEDAAILATRQATSAFVSLDAARAIDTDLAAMRALYPAFVSVHARPRFVTKTLLVTIKPAAPWRSKWDASANAASTITDTDLTTGEPVLDALLQKYGATRISRTYDSGTDTLYELRFAQPLNLQTVADELMQSSSTLVSVYPNATIGDGDDIAFTPPTHASGDKTYVFSKGSGDCPGGCLYRYNQPVVIPANGPIYQIPVPPPQ